MRQVPDTWLFEPWLMPHSVQAHTGVRLGIDLAQPLVDLAQATREAKQQLHSRRQTTEVKAGKQAVIDKHASRKNWGNKQAPRASTPRASTPQKSAATQQLVFDF
jgi:deoxyribodipyrimidine photo-lyase